MFEYASSGVILALFIWIPLSKSQLVLSVYEEQDVGTLVGRVDGATNYYTLTSTPYFELTNGNLVTKVKIDRESLENDVITLTAVPGSPGEPPIEISVTVKDINDNDPRFPVTPLSINLTEISSSVEQLIEPLAEDDDIGENAELMYEIVSGNRDIFQLSLISTYERTLLYLNVLQLLSRETLDRYELNISAVDGGTQPRRGYLQLIINVFDINDNSPKFEEPEYSESIPEDVDVGTVLLSVHANDADLGRNGRVTYSIDSTDSQPVPGAFTVNATSGEIILASSLDYETQKIHKFKIVATDGGSPSMKGYTEVTINVEDTNDNDPVITFRYRPGGTSVASVDVNMNIGWVFAFVGVSDPDKSSPTDVSMDIVSGNELGFFKLVQFLPQHANIQVANNKSLNDQPFYNLTIRANDTDPESERFALASMIILVNSGENHPPKFDHKIYNATISEISPIGSVVAGVRAVDSDAGLNGRLVYGIEDGNEFKWFSIERTTGLIKTVKTLHFEQTEAKNGSIILHISAKDETTNHLSDDTEMRIVILDENDNAPVFTGTAYSLSVAENTIGRVGKIEANDDDYGLNGEVTYHLKYAKLVTNSKTQTLSDFESYFAVFEDGSIFTLRELDREYAASYVLQASATDSGAKPRTSYVEVTINVSDVNDNAPSFYPLLYFATVSTDTSPAAGIVTVQAADMDSLDEGRITYHFGDSPRANYYKLDTTTGKITLAQQVAHRNGAHDSLTVYAKDATGRVSHVNATVSITITSMPPKVAFDKLEYEFYLLENSEEDFHVGDVRLTKFDSAKFYIADGDENLAFRIDTDSGSIAVGDSTLIDAEMSNLYNLTVVAEILGTPTSRTFGSISTHCLVHIVDVNDNFPIFQFLSLYAGQQGQNSYTDRVHVEVGAKSSKTKIYVAEAVDEDSFDGGEVLYHLSSSYPSLEIDDTTGVVYVKPWMLQPSEDFAKFQAEISACDNGYPSLCSTIILNVTMTFLDRLFSHALTNVYVEFSESILVHSEIAQLSYFGQLAIPDIDANVSYSLEPRGYFNIFPGGEVLLIMDLDYETSVGQELTLKMGIEKEGEIWERTAVLSVVVVDQNDNAPEIENLEFQFSVKENAKPGDFIGCVKATDMDSGIYGSLAYSIQSETKGSGELLTSSLFYCDRSSGDIYITQSPDRMFLRLLGMQSGEITLTMEITDQHGENSSSSHAHVTIVDIIVTIQFENRHDLAFESSTYYTEVQENLFTQNILKVATFDRDSAWDALPDVKYEIQDSLDAEKNIPFTIGYTSGIVGLKDEAILDREKTAVHLLKLKASYLDGSESAYADLIVRVLDVKDSPPAFAKEYYEFRLPEDLAPMSFVGRVEARDGDELNNRTKIRYEITSEGDSKFAIDSRSGFLFLVDYLDFETRQQYNMTVEATDESGESSSVHVQIEVQDTNDNSPRFGLGARSSSTITEGFYSVPTEVATVRATDTDSGNYGRVRYSLVSVSPGGSLSQSGFPVIRVDADSGKVTVSGMVDRKIAEELVITVRATDMDETATSQNFNDKKIRVKINDANNNSPKFTSSSSVILEPNYASRIGHEIMKISATDLDQGPNGEVMISIPENGMNADKFTIDSEGNLVLRSQLSTESVEHSVDLVATDKGIQRRQTSARVNIILANQPISTTGDTFRSVSTVSIPETSQAGSHVTIMSSGNGRNSDALFYLTKSTTSDGDVENGMFSIDHVTGEILSMGDFTAKGGTEYVLEVVSVKESTGRWQAQISRKSVTIKITDENNNAPVFSSYIQRIAVSESARPQSKVTTIKATDADASDEIAYSIQTKSGQPVRDFSVNSKTGEISVGETGLNREKQLEYHLEVVADDGLHRSSTELLVDIEDVNDNSPTFSSNPACFDVRENSPTGTVVGRAEATDVDLNASIEYTISDSGSDSGMFRIHETYGTITYEGAYSDLDRETQDLYILRIRATDEGGLFSETKVFIYVTDENDHPPVFDDANNNDINISEKTLEGTRILTVTATDADIGLNAEIHYSILSGDESGDFQIGGVSGEIRTVSTLSRENRSSYHMTIMASNKFAEDGNRQRTNKSILVTIQDENDNAPSIANQPISYLKEEAKIGDVVFHINALDPDLERNQDVELNLVSQLPDHGIFRLDGSSGNLIVTDNSKLDYEGTKEYNLTITARDDGISHRSSTMHFVVRVLDANDNRPAFSDEKYSASVVENSAIGRYLLSVQATDSDSGYNADIRYSIIPSSDSSSVYINRFTGEIYLANFLDHEVRKEISFEVQASDGGVDPYRTAVSVVITVQDENDCSPVIKPTYSIVHVKENEFNPVEALVKLFASDQDSGNNGIADIRSSLEVTPDSDAFAITLSIDGSASLVLRKTLDRESSKKYEVTATAVDRGTPPRKGTATVLVIVDDENDQIPEFDQYEYHAEISEDSPPGTRLTSVKIKATDRDGSDITYKLDAGSEVHPFYIHPSTGEVFTRGYLNRETVEYYNLTIFAIDAADFNGFQNQAFVPLFVRVLDVNDNPPRFSSDRMDVFVDSRNSVGNVMIAEAFDPDSGENGRITYSITDNSSSSSFTINPETGQINAMKALTAGHRLEVHATDNGELPYSSTLDIHVYMADARRPTITHDIKSPPRLSENGRAKPLGKFRATSTRIGAGTIEFYLKGDWYGWFSLNQVTGQLSVRENTDRELTPVVTLWIEARDSGSPKLSAFVKIVINVEDENDNAPLFQNAVYTFHVKENEAKTIATMFAFDPDEGQNGEVFYDIVSQLSEKPERFAIDSTSGDLRNLVELNREDKSGYKLVIRASDKGSPPLHRDVMVHIIVDNVNDEPPRFIRLFSASIEEDASIGHIVLQVTTTDDDEIFNHTYELVEDSDGHFSIDRDGIITVAKGLDREELETHYLKVKSKDEKWSTETSVTIRVEDANDNPPTFSPSNLHASASVETVVGSVLLQLNASDADDGLNAQMSYRILGGSQFFSVNSLGQISTSRELECTLGLQGCPVEHSFKIIACDSGMPNLECGFCPVTIRIKSVNRNFPQFEEDGVRVALPQSLQPGTEVYPLSATDSDPGTTLSYEISRGNDLDYFSVSSSDKVGLERSVFSFSVGQTLQIAIKVSDDGVPSKSATVNIIFEVTGENLNSPEFSESIYNALPVPENATAGSAVIRVKAGDDDAGINGKVNYEIVGGNGEGKFQIDKNSGVVSLAGYLDYEQSPSYDISVRAFDSGMLQRSAVVKVRIPIEDVNDDVPQFNASRFEIRIYESTPRDNFFTTFSARDDDQGRSAVVRYSTDEDTLIGIGPLSGAMYLNSELDFEAQRSHSVRIYARNDEDSRRSEAEVLISVLGSNEFSPRFSERRFEFNMPHLAEEGTEVGTVPATDNDAGIDGAIDYILNPSADSGNFRLDKTSGNLIVFDGSSYSVGDVVSFSVIAKNPTTSADACLFDEVPLKITVISNDCHKSPCKNNATCMDGPESVVCYCLPGYTEKYCDIDIDDCEGRPCVNGVCEDLVNGYLCLCNPGVTGTNCDVTIDHCEDVPCKNGGTCLNNPTGFTCQCPFGATGETCEVQSLNFPAQSFLVVDGFKSEMTFEFSTVSDNALLLYSGRTTGLRLTLEILDRELQLTLHPDGNIKSFIINLERVVNDGQWHTARITKDGRDCSLVLDDCSFVQFNQCFNDTITLDQDINLPTDDLIIGGIQSVADLKTGLLSTHDFIGCIRSISLDSDLVTSSSSFHITENYLVKDGCGKVSSVAACTPSLCQNEGLCTDLWTSALCSCADDWEGQRCDKQMAGQTFTGEGLATISFTESFIRDAVLEESFSRMSRKRRSVGSLSSSLEVRFRTRRENSLLITAANGDGSYYAALFIKSGTLRYQHKVLNSVKEVQVEGNAADGTWHTAIVHITNRDQVTAVVKVKFDDAEVQESFDRDLNVIDRFSNPTVVKNIFIGGIPESAVIGMPVEDFFKGCLFHFKLDDVVYQLNPNVTTSTVSVSIEGSGISESCNGTGLTCGDVTCENGYSCVPNQATVSMCVCTDGYVESNGACTMVSAAGLDWWIILIIAILAVVLVSGALVFATCFKRRRERHKSGQHEIKENRTANSTYEFQARNVPTAPDLLPEDKYAVADDVKKQVEPDKDVLPTVVSTSVALVPVRNGTGHNEPPPKCNGYKTPHKEELISGRKSANDIMKNENFSSAKRPASAQANLAPVTPRPVPDGGFFTPDDYKRHNKFHISHARTLPRKVSSRRLEYANDTNQDMPRRPRSRSIQKTRSSSRSGEDKRRHKRKSREAETLELMMQELSGIAGLTREEMELLHAGALALGHDTGGLFDDGSSVSASSLTDLSIQSRTTASSLRVRSFVRSATPQQDATMRDIIPGAVINQSQQSIPRPGSRGHDLTDEYNNLGPFEFPPPPSDSDTDEPNSTSDSDTWGSATSDETAISTIKKANSSDVSSSGGGNQAIKLDLNFPSNLEEYFTSLVDVFEDISQLNSDKNKWQQKPKDHLRRPSVLPGFVSNEVSLWSEIEALSKRPLKRINKRRRSFDLGSQSSLSGRESEGRATPVRKTGNRMNSPMVKDIIPEEVVSREASSSTRSPKSPDEGIETSRRSTSRSSSGRSTKGSKMKAEFVKFV